MRVIITCLVYFLGTAIADNMYSFLVGYLTGLVVMFVLDFYKRWDESKIEEFEQSTADILRGYIR